MITFIKWLPHLLMIAFAFLGFVLIGNSAAGLVGIAAGALIGQVVGWIIRRVLIGNIGVR